MGQFGVESCVRLEPTRAAQLARMREPTLETLASRRTGLLQKRLRVVFEGAEPSDRQVGASGLGVRSALRAFGDRDADRDSSEIRSHDLCNTPIRGVDAEDSAPFGSPGQSSGCAYVRAIDRVGVMAR